MWKPNWFEFGFISTRFWIFSISAQLSPLLGVAVVVDVHPRTDAGQCVVPFKVQRKGHMYDASPRAVVS